MFKQGECFLASSDKLASELLYKPKIRILASLYWLLQTIALKKYVPNSTFVPRNFMLFHVVFIIKPIFMTERPWQKWCKAPYTGVTYQKYHLTKK